MLSLILPVLLLPPLSAEPTMDTGTSKSSSKQQQQQQSKRARQASLADCISGRTQPLPELVSKLPSFWHNLVRSLSGLGSDHCEFSFKYSSKLSSKLPGILFNADGAFMRRLDTKGQYVHMPTDLEETRKELQQSEAAATVKKGNEYKAQMKVFRALDKLPKLEGVMTGYCTQVTARCCCCWFVLDALSPTGNAVPVCGTQGGSALITSFSWQ